jgi:signal transduction histidine kinase
MGSRIVRLALMAAAAALVLFGVPLAVGLGQYAATEERASLQRLADFAARSVQEDMAHDRVPARLPDPPDDAAVALYDDDGELLLGDGPPRGDEPVNRALQRGVLSIPPDQFVVAAPVSDTHEIVGVIRVAVPAGSVVGGLVPIWIGMGVLAGLVLLVVWLLARRLALRLTRPLQQLAMHAGRLGDGDFGVRPEVTGIREVDLVGTALGGTARRLDDLLARERAFSAEASHQLRTPLAGLRLRLESTLDRPDRLTRATVEDGLASIDRLERTIDELLLLARERRTLSIPVDLAQLLKEAEDEWRDRLAGEGRAFTTSLAPNLLNPMAGAAAVRQIMAVLLDNACQHGAGAVSLGAREAGPDAIALEVSDGGPGIPDNALNGGPGRHGMGVALARRLAEAEGGRLTARRSPSVVSLLLPVLQPASDGAVQAAADHGDVGRHTNGHANHVFEAHPDEVEPRGEPHAPRKLRDDGRVVVAGFPLDAPAGSYLRRGGRTPG